MMGSAEYSCRDQIYVYNKKRIELEMKGDGGLPVGRKKRMEVQKYTIDQETSYRLSVLKFIFMVMVVFIHSDALPELVYGSM